MSGFGEYLESVVGGAVGVNMSRSMGRTGRGTSKELGLLART